MGKAKTIPFYNTSGVKIRLPVPPPGERAHNWYELMQKQSNENLINWYKWDTRLALEKEKNMQRAAEHFKRHARPHLDPAEYPPVSEPVLGSAVAETTISDAQLAAALGGAQGKKAAMPQSQTKDDPLKKPAFKTQSVDQVYAQDLDRALQLSLEQQVQDEAKAAEEAVVVAKEDDDFALAIEASERDMLKLKEALENEERAAARARQAAHELAQAEIMEHEHKNARERRKDKRRDAAKTSQWAVVEAQAKAERSWENLRRVSAPPPAPAPTPAPAPAPENVECVICLSEVATHVVVPCGHQALCGNCVPEELLECPVCRVHPTQVIRLYKP